MRHIKKRHKTLELLLFVAPFGILFSIFLLYPLVKGVIYSFTDWNGVARNVNFVGLRNYIQAFTEDDRFANSLFVTGIFTVFNVIFSNVLGLALALFVEHFRRRKGLVRTLFFLPYIFSLVVVGFSWKLMYTKVAEDLYELTKIGIFNLDFLGSKTWALPSVLIMSIWQGVGYYLIIYIAGIQSLDMNLLEAADIDGANAWHKFWKMKLPLLMPSITICVFTSIASSLKIFDAVFVLTSGGPGYSTETIAINIYNEAFGSASNYGYGMAKAVILALIIFIISAVQLKYFKGKEVEA